MKKNYQYYIESFVGDDHVCNQNTYQQFYSWLLEYVEPEEAEIILRKTIQQEVSALAEKIIFEFEQDLQE